MSLMDLIHRAWKYACGTLDKHDHKTRPPELDVLFMQEINKLGRNTSYIVAMLYSNYAGTKSSLDMISKDYEKLEEKHHKLKDEREHEDKKREFLILERDKLLLVAKHNQEAYDSLLQANTKQIELSNDLLDQRDDLESSLNTSRYFIYLSGMCGFVLGLACLYLVV